jgi:hypothetical protein
MEAVPIVHQEELHPSSQPLLVMKFAPLDIIHQEVIFAANCVLRESLAMPLHLANVLIAQEGHLQISQVKKHAPNVVNACLHQRRVRQLAQGASQDMSGLSILLLVYPALLENFQMMEEVASCVFLELTLHLLEEVRVNHVLKEDGATLQDLMTSKNEPDATPEALFLLYWKVGSEISTFPKILFSFAFHNKLASKEDLVVRNAHLGMMERLAATVLWDIFVLQTDANHVFHRGHGGW